LLEDFCDGVEPEFFYGSLWECVLASHANRLAAINYVLSHFNRKKSLEDQIHFLGSNVNLLVTTCPVVHTYLKLHELLFTNLVVIIFSTYSCLALFVVKNSFMS